MTDKEADTSSWLALFPGDFDSPKLIQDIVEVLFEKDRATPENYLSAAAGEYTERQG